MKSKWLMLAFVGVLLGLTCPLLAKRAQRPGLITEFAGLP